MSNDVLEQNVQTETKTKKRRGTWLLILLLFLLVLFLASSAVLGSQLHRISTRDKYTVDLGMDAPMGNVELFRIEYANDSGDITVKGTNGENVVAPGTAIDYDLRLRNQDDCIIDFVMVPTVEFFTDAEVPVEFKMVDTYGNYILGSESEWATASQMNGLTHKGTVHEGEVFTYHISWRWVFENGAEQDAYDTSLGNASAAGKNAPGLSVKIETQASANPMPAKSNAHMAHLLGEGFGCCWCCWLVWFLLLVCVLLLVWIWRLRRKLSKTEEKQEEYEKLLLANGVAIGVNAAGQSYAE